MVKEVGKNNGCKNKTRGNKLRHNPNVKLFYTKNHKESEVAFKILKSNEIFFSAIDVEKHKMTHYLERDIGTVKIPTIVSSSGTYAGLNCIKSFIGKK